MVADAPIDVSVIIPAYFGARTIVATVESVRRAVQGRRAEILVVDSSGDETAALLRERFPDVTVIVSPERLAAGGARNLGLSHARGRFLLFTDQDCLVPPDWVDRLVAHLETPGIGAAGGSVGIQNLSNLSGCGVYFLEFLQHFPRHGPATRDDNFLVGCNSAYRAETLVVLRFPDQTLGEDVIFSHDLTSLGFGVMYDPAITVMHFNREGWGEFFRYNRKMGQSAAVYHGILRRWWIQPFFKAPLLAFLAPFAILPAIGIDLLRSRWSYFFRFLLLLPMCFAGNLVWAAAFRRQVLDARASRSS